MVRKVEMLAAKAGAVEGDSAIEREGLKLAQDMPLKEQVIFTGSTDWSPDQAEHYIDWRIQCIDTDNRQAASAARRPHRLAQAVAGGHGRSLQGVRERQRPRRGEHGVTDWLNHTPRNELRCGASCFLAMAPLARRTLHGNRERDFEGSAATHLRIQIDGAAKHLLGDLAHRPSARSPSRSRTPGW